MGAQSCVLLSSVADKTTTPPLTPNKSSNVLELPDLKPMTHEQIDLESGLVSRFGLIFKFVDQSDAELDDTIADTILLSKDVAKRYNANLGSVTETECDGRSVVSP